MFFLLILFFFFVQIISVLNPRCLHCLDFFECKNKERRAPTHTLTATKQSERLTFAKAGCTCLYVYKYESLYLWCSSTYIYLILRLTKTLVYLFKHSVRCVSTRIEQKLLSCFGFVCRKMYLSI